MENITDTIPVVCRAHVAELFHAKYNTLVALSIDFMIPRLQLDISQFPEQLKHAALAYLYHIVSAQLSTLRRALEVILRHTQPSQAVILMPDSYAGSFT